MTKLVGISSFTSKKGNPCYTITTLADCTERDNEVGRYGQKAETLFVDKVLYEKLKPQDCGKQIIIDYEVTGTYARVIGLSVK